MVGTITIRPLPQNRPIDISIPNIGRGGNPNVDWTPSGGNFNTGGGATNSPSPFIAPPTINLPSMPSGGNGGAYANNSTPQKVTNVISTPVDAFKGNSVYDVCTSGNIFDCSNKNLTPEDIKTLSDRKTNFSLVNFSNNPKISGEATRLLVFGEGGLKNIMSANNGSTDLVYQGFLGKKGAIITKLDMSNCDIDDLGGQTISAALYTNYTNVFLTINHLNLSDNNIGDSSTYSFGRYDYPCASPSLRILDLSNNKITDNGVASLCRALEHNRLYYLKHLDVSGNKITEEGNKQLATAVNKAPNIDLVVTLEKSSNSSGVWNFIKKAFNYYSEEHSKKLEENSKAALAIHGNDNWANCKKLIHDTGQDMSMGIVKHSSHVVAKQLIQKAPPQVKAATIGTIFVAAGVDAAQAVDVKNFAYCIAAVNKEIDDYLNYDSNLPENSVGFIGQNGEIVDG